MSRKRLTLPQKLWRVIKRHAKAEVERKTGTGRIATKRRAPSTQGLPVDDFTDADFERLRRRYMK